MTLFLVLCVFVSLTTVIVSLRDHIIYTSDPDFTVDLTRLELLEYIKGGGGGVFILKDGNKSYTLKFNKDLSHFQEEVLADKLYDVLGVSTPKFLIVNNFTSMPENIQVITKYIPFVRIAEFVYKDIVTDLVGEKVLHKKHLQNNFVIDCFLANRDVSKLSNTIYHNGTFYRIDNGGSLRNRSVGKKKGTKKSDHWDPYLIPELKSFMYFHPEIYSGITNDIIITQSKYILSKMNHIIESFNHLATSIMMDAISREELTNMILKRFEFLQMLVSPGTSFDHINSDSRLRPVTALTGAGTFLICNMNNIPHVLLGSRRSSHENIDHTWCSFGGKSDYGDDKTLIHTALRELYEETIGLMDLYNEFSNNTIYHDLIHEDFLFRQYFIEILSCPNADNLHHNKEIPHELHHNHHLGDSEYHKFQWYPVSDLLNITGEGDFGNPTQQLYHKFALLLHIPHIKYLLQSIINHNKIIEHRYTQSIAINTKNQTPIYGSFIPIHV